MDSVGAPPPIDHHNVIEIDSIARSKIIGVSLYSGRAEITRLYSFAVKTGLNSVEITGLPQVLDQQSLRVEGRGAATIHDVTVSSSPRPMVATTSEGLKSFLDKKERTQKALERCSNALAALEAYLGTLTIGKVEADKIGSILKEYDHEAEKLNSKMMDLTQQLSTLDEEIKSEREKLTGPEVNQKLGLQATIGVFAPSANDVEITLIYAVSSATWNALYDIRVDMDAKEKPVTLIYKAAITQSTGESWDDVPLTLETAIPTFGLGVPELRPWNLSIYQERSRSMSRKSKSVGYASAPLPQYVSTVESSTFYNIYDPTIEETVQHRTLQVTSKGNVSATFEVPGVISIPSDGEAHNVTIIQLELDASMSWIAVPKHDIKTHLKAKIKNASEYTLLAGSASVYVNGSFISRPNLPLVSPQENFDCPLGLDPSIKITYHPRNKNLSQSGFYQKTSTQVVSQRITISNTKTVPISDVKILDQFPISENSSITVKRVTPALALPSATSGSDKNLKLPAPLSVSKGVIAQWDGADEVDVDLTVLGKDGKFNWVCSILPQEKVNLLLSWEVTFPANETIVGL